MKALSAYFVKGLLFVVPLAVTIYAAGKILTVSDLFLRRIFGINIPVLGFLFAIAALTGIGYLTTNIFTRGIIGFVDRMLRRVPFVKLVYTSIGDLINAFVGKKKGFDKPVMVSLFPGSGAKALGFITCEDLAHLGIADHVLVYFPQSYNFAGQALLIPRNDVVPLKGVSSSEVMTTIVSAGIAGRRAEDERKA